MGSEMCIRDRAKRAKGGHVVLFRAQQVKCVIYERSTNAATMEAINHRDNVAVLFSPSVVSRLGRG